ncbi:CPBP family intramembrane glutamic endopeptidase [Peribacillus deserti]|uniref:CPBP family intramembrane metalloprotease n=1 Tax=Peribacillus deserti TaxID=673318 RepID=A0A2N5M3K0_9BACI|nr:type II CAAX endopeptidase family protein [Peribacillus deserti]PLT28941.1 CPBP family intramembrane metalloprotease [Peribacillus deserti]
MTVIIKDKIFWSGLVLAHLGIFASYYSVRGFWGTYTAASACLAVFALFAGEPRSIRFPFRKFMIGILSGLILYGIFYAGLTLLTFLNIDLAQAADQLYLFYKPEVLWQYLVLVLLLIPAEELFWRSFIQGRLSRHFPGHVCILLSSLLYTLPMFYSKNAAMVLAGLTAGLLWGILFQRTRSLGVVIVSHLTFDIFLLILLPLESGQH